MINIAPGNGVCLMTPSHGPLARYVKLGVAHAPGMLGTFSPPPSVSNPDMHHGTCVTPWCMSGSLTSGFLWSWWRGKCSRHSRHMRHPHFYVSGKSHINCASVDWSSVRSCVIHLRAISKKCSRYLSLVWVWNYSFKITAPSTRANEFMISHMCSVIK